VNEARRIFLDCEFLDLPWTENAGLLWIGLADNDGNTWSAIDRDADMRRANQFVRDVVLPQIPSDEQRLSAAELSEGVVRFCGEVDEFWAWCPTVEDLVTAFGLSQADASAAHAIHWDFDFQLLRGVIDPWPSRWPVKLHDLKELATLTGITVPANEHAHHPSFDALWGRRVFQQAAETTGIYPYFGVDQS
jgi:hypothetical protein